MTKVTASLYPEEISPAVAQRFLEAHPRQMRRAFSRLPEEALADFTDALHPEREPQRYVAVVISRITRQMIDRDLAITRRIPALMMASVHGGVRPWVQHGSSVT